MEEMYSDFTKIGVSGASKDKATSEAKESLYASADFDNASRLFKSCAFTLIEESEKNTAYIAKVAMNPKVIEREDVDVMQAVAKRRSWLKSDLSWKVGLDDPQVIERVIEDAKSYDEVMEILVDDVILNRDDAIQIINQAFSFDTSKESKEYAGKIQLQEKLRLNDDFQNASSSFQERIFTLISTKRENMDYISKVAMNPSVIAREDYDLVEKVANARVQADPSYASSLNVDERRAYLTSALETYHYTMNLLTDNSILEQSNAGAIVDAVFSTKTGKEALALTENILAEIKSNENIMDSMVTEATAPQVQDTTGFSK